MNSNLQALQSLVWPGSVVHYDGIVKPISIIQWNSKEWWSHTHNGGKIHCLAFSHLHECRNMWQLVIVAILKHCILSSHLHTSTISFIQSLHKHMVQLCNVYILRIHHVACVLYCSPLSIEDCMSDKREGNVN